MNDGKKAQRSKYRNEYPGEFIFDFKDPVTMQRFVTDGGKIVPSRISKLSQAQQRAASKAVKIARNLGLVPTGTQAYNNFQRPEQVSPVPFEFEA